MGDFGYDLDEEGQPLSEDDQLRAEEGRQSNEPSRGGRELSSAMALKDVKSRIASVKNIQKITRAMEMVAAARLRRPSSASKHCARTRAPVRRMTRQAAEAAGNVPNFRSSTSTTPRTRSASCWSRATVAWPAPSTRRSCARACGRATSTSPRARPRCGSPRVVAACRRWRSVAARPRRVHRLHRPPVVRQRARDRVRARRRLRGRRGRPRRDRLQPLRLGLTQEVTRETLLPLQQATIMGDDGAVDSLGERAAVKEDGSSTRITTTTRWWSTSPTPRSSSSV